MAAGISNQPGVYARFVKRFIDVVLSGVLLIILSPLLLVVSILVRAKLGSPVIFSQERPGRDGIVFKMYKFRTMLPPQTLDGRTLTDEERLRCIANGVEVLSDEARLTRFGRVLRATSIDELPELVNILKGDMSFVGPRPLAVIYLPYYTLEEDRRHLVRPGLTGWAQVHGRNSANWTQRFRYDIEYVDNLSLRMDIAALAATFKVVLSRNDVGQGSEKPLGFHEQRQEELDKGTVQYAQLARSDLKKERE